MVQRASQPVAFDTGARPGVQQPGAGYTSPEHYAKQVIAVDSGSSRVLNGIFKNVESLAQQGFQKSLEDAYIAGAAQVGQIESEAELQGDIFSHDWQVGGYRDTQTRLAMAESEAQLEQDMAWLRRESPERFNQYLQEQRATLMPGIESMTRDGRQQATQKMMALQYALTKKHTEEHKKWIIEQETGAIQATTATAFKRLDEARVSSAGTYTAMMIDTANTLSMNILNNPRLDEGTRRKLLKETFEYALESEHPALYDTLKNLELPDGSTMYGRLSLDEQGKLNAKYLSTLDKTKAFRAGAFLENTGKLEAVLADENAPIPPREQVQGLIDFGVQQRIMSASEEQNLWEKYYKRSQKDTDLGTLASAWASGDTQTLANMDKTKGEGLKAWRTLQARSKVPVDNQIASLMAIGNKSGQHEAFKEVGDMMQDAIGQFQFNEQVDPANAAMVQNVLTSLDAASSDPKLSGAYVQFLSALKPEQATYVQYLRDEIKRGVPIEAARKAVGERVAAEAKLSLAEKAAGTSKAATADEKFVLELAPRGIFATMWNLFDPVERTIRPGAAPFEADMRAAAILAPTKRAMLQELAELRLQAPGLADSARQEQAMAQVAARTARTSNSSLVLPKDTNVAQFFGVPASTNLDQIGRALEKVQPLNDKRNRFAYEVAQGSILAREYDDNGEFVRAVEINPKKVGELLNKQTDSETKKHRAAFGDGVSVNGVVFNGMNGAGANPKVMLAFRRNLVNNEGVRTSEYSDQKGNTTIGVGIANKEYWPHLGTGRSMTQDELNSSFAAASNDAMAAGIKVASGIGLRNEHSLMFLGELAYHSGKAFYELPAYKPMLTAMATRDTEAAVKAFRATKAYEVSAPSRRQHYEVLLRRAMLS